MIGRSKHALGAALLGILAFACSGKDPYSPGTKLGTFHVTARLTQTSCGAAPDPWEFDVRLNHDGTTLYWIQGGAPIGGRVDGAAKTELKSETTHDVRAADPKAKRAACTIARSDLLDVALVASDAQPATDPAVMTSFAGRLVYSFTPTDGSDCVDHDQLTETGGGFAVLPCQIRYEIAGTLKATPH